MNFHEWIWGSKRTDVYLYVDVYGIPVPMGIYNRLPKSWRQRRVSEELKRRREQERK